MTHRLAGCAGVARRRPGVVAALRPANPTCMARHCTALPATTATLQRRYSDGKGQPGLRLRETVPQSVTLLPGWLNHAKNRDASHADNSVQHKVLRRKYTLSRSLRYVLVTTSTVVRPCQKRPCFCFCSRTSCSRAFSYGVNGTSSTSGGATPTMLARRKN